MGWLAGLIQRHWQHPQTGLAILLWPLARIFQIIAMLRRWLYRVGLLPSKRLPCPVVVIGNIHVGGVGKTPLVAALVQALHQRQIKVGIISRGYGRSSKDTVIINARTTASEAGDEPLMLFKQTQAPIAVASTREAAGKALLQAHPDLQLLLSDDGLQHYALKRDMEIVVFPAADIGKTMDLLPNGPLRESLGRLHLVDGVIFSQGDAIATHRAQQLDMLKTQWCGYSTLNYADFYCLNQPRQTAQAIEFAGRHCAAIAAIGRPERFFQALQTLGIDLKQTIALDDHAVIKPADWPEADVIFITEKDAVKLTMPLQHNIWVLPLSAQICPDLAEFIQSRLQLRSTATIKTLS
ncbi:tetraacyldisaccharide 4'-kinase [Snodgrassella sp. ESL0253]|uniref:tetraacyldisaccharide 4'-kinase n=1 Tax=Snodgrassella sp. ESL0253 TaxID=2705031 RepID=UPI001581A3B9|nr:tetraacyldisaccharide 4'-kinase [Snodgrassella sp. ESL0253]NUE66824.1 tetraacyldisaccharide 4'-kinase [Snodgrassella sp. ESL0253]